MADSAIHAAAGAAGGCIAMAITYPLINVSTRAQVETTRVGNKPPGFLRAVRDVVGRDGVVALYDGLGSSLFAISITQGIYYLLYEESRSVLLRAKTTKRLSTLESMLSSFIAGSGTSILSNPIWVINTRQTVQTSLPISEADISADASSHAGDSASYPTNQGKERTKIVKKKLGFIATILNIIKHDGPMRFFDGLGPALFLVINPILQYTLFEQIKNVILSRRNSSALRDRDTFLLGAFTKLVATGLTYPVLTVKSRMQAGSNAGKSYGSSLHGIKSIIEREGVWCLYRGIGPKLTQSVLTAAILMAAKEKVYRATKTAFAAAQIAKK